MQLNEFNHASKQELAIFLKHCVPIERWSVEILARRPFASVEQLLEFAQQQSITWTWQEIATALAQHPRIGEKTAQAALSDQEYAFSRREQAAVKLDTATQQALRQANLAYENKFGHLFLIKAFGLDTMQILQALKYRLLNETETEQGIVKHQLAEIALFRLQQEFAPNSLNPHI